MIMVRTFIGETLDNRDSPQFDLDFSQQVYINFKCVLEFWKCHNVESFTFRVIKLIKIQEE